MKKNLFKLQKRKSENGYNKIMFLIDEREHNTQNVIAKEMLHFT